MAPLEEEADALLSEQVETGERLRLFKRPLADLWMVEGHVVFHASPKKMKQI